MLEGYEKFNENFKYIEEESTDLKPSVSLSRMVIKW